MSSSTDTRRFSPLPLPSPSGHDDRQAAQALGYAEGWSTGQRAAAARAEAVQVAIVQQHVDNERGARVDVEQAIAALRSATSQLTGTVVPTVEDLADVVLETALTLARAILDAELNAVDDVAVAALRRALRPLPSDARVTVRLSPADHERVVVVAGAPDAQGTTSFDGYDLRLVADATLRAGDAVAEQAGAVVDARIEAGLARALEVVRTTGGAA